MRSRLAVFAFVVVASTFNVSIHAQLSEFAPPIAANNEAAYENLEKTISVDYFEMRFADVLTDLEGLLGQRFLIHESAADNGLELDSFITFKLNKVRACTLIEMMLEEFSCTYHIQDGVVRILCRDRARDTLSRYVTDQSVGRGDIENLQNVIQEIVEPDSWEENGGTGRIMNFGERLVIAQTDHNIRQIRDLLFVLDAIDR